MPSPNELDAVARIDKARRELNRAIIDAERLGTLNIAVRADVLNIEYPPPKYEPIVIAVTKEIKPAKEAT